MPLNQGGLPMASEFFEMPMIFYRGKFKMPMNFIGSIKMPIDFTKQI